MLLLIDIGNTRLKWATFQHGVVDEQRAHVHAGWTREDFARHVIAAMPRPEQVLVSNVGGERIAEVVRAAVFDAWGMQAKFFRASSAAGGVRNAYPMPEHLGVDRWLAMIGARSIQSGWLCVASIGTAMTIDALDPSGVHLGGAIVPGPDLMIASLLHGTSDIAARAGSGELGESIFANNTRGAVMQGAVHALAGLIDRSVQVLNRDRQHAVSLLLTGGASSAVARFVISPFVLVPDLVLRGLAVLAAEAQGA